MSFVGNSAGFNLTSGKLQLVEINVKGTEVILENADDFPFDEKLHSDAKESAFIALLQESYDNLSNRKKPEFTSVSFSLPAEYFHCFNLPREKKLLKKEFEDHIKWEFQTLFPGKNPEDFIIQTVELGADNNNIFVICIAKSNVKKIHKFCVRNNLKLKFIDFAHLSVHNYLTNLNGENDIFLSIYTSGKAISFALIKNGIVENIRLLQNESDKGIPEFVSEKLDAIFPGIDEKYTGIKYYFSGDVISQSERFEFESGLNRKFLNVNPFDNFKLSTAMEHLENDENNSHFLAATSMALRFS